MPVENTHFSISIRRLWALLLLAAILGLSACGETRQDNGRDGVLVAGEKVEAPQSLERARAVHALSVNRERLLAMTEAETVRGFLHLQDGTRLDYRVTHVEGDPPRVWRGDLISGDERVSGFTLSRTGNRLAGGFQVADQRFRLASQREGGHLLVELAHEDAPPHGQPLVPEKDEEGKEKEGG
ncbi:hypothetical protein VCB98_06170 [Gammaproteobacteria bacterium AB-CW1]|uniref:Uncharacterized protein n=1 Tax=Natronospira elongata TaxID=3110268 RepID=A0AAP6JEC7_9GAMM|nr:hypothetical protein [Gammaproteobacteria bacterium AB-CW1]